MTAKSLLQHLVQGASGYVELRWHKRTSCTFEVTQGRVLLADRAVIEGVGVRTLIDGAWGVAATSDVSERGVRQAITQAREAAALLLGIRGKRPLVLAQARLSTRDFVGSGFVELASMGLADKLGEMIDLERRLAGASARLQSAEVRYTEYLEEKAIVTSDGANCSLRMAQCELALAAIAQRHGRRATSTSAAGVNGDWSRLFHHPSLESAIEDVASTAVALLDARHPEPGRQSVILAPALVGLLCHEAVGHTVEADLVASGSVAAGKIGQQVASALVTMADTGDDHGSAGAMGSLPFDDEGVETEATVIIRSGMLENYLHSRESAARFGVRPAGNARAWLYSDEPLIRMRNTYIAPGTTCLADMIAGINDGYLLEGAGNGQADTNGEFMFGCDHVWEIKNGRKSALLQGASVSGMAFDVLKSVDAVSSDFRWDLGMGHCGKGQRAKVDAGGPYLRCEMNVGGRA
ncbi:TldD/PmbA family protein [Massilia sp. TWP1-3-3]|uniref:TldD/PmbA family protein n=1 Tax=Massilia sp. TWP1-3-3 TaxID=2804573 RepID=UPI003CEAD220